MVVCPICNKQLKQITNTHLIKHNMSIEAFDILYPNFIKQIFDLSKSKSKMLDRVSLYNKEPKLCKNCNKHLSYKKRNNSFCDKSCGASFNNSKRIITEETKIKISNSLMINTHCTLFWNECIVCYKTFLYKNENKKTCSKNCNYIIQKQILNNNAIKAGKISASKQIRRSKNEKKLFDLLSCKFKCLNNIPLFNGWDADIVIEDLKLAILWNGPWHYKNVMNGHSFKQTYNRDMIKLNEIYRMNYNFIIVKDYNNKMNVNYAFETICEYIENNNFNLTII